MADAYLPPEFDSQLPPKKPRTWLTVVAIICIILVFGFGGCLALVDSIGNTTP